MGLELGLRSGKLWNSSARLSVRFRVGLGLALALGLGVRVRESGICDTGLHRD